MKKILSTIIYFSLISLVFGQMNGGGHNRPDSMDIVTVSGTVKIDETSMNPMYFLDESGDEVADYHLNFGPYWYEPDSSDAVRPNAGDFITITGGLNNDASMFYPTIIVYEINDNYWRDPYLASWNNLGGRHNHQMGGHNGGQMGYGFGYDHDTLETVSLDGTILADTTFYINHFYLDTDGDDLPDYTLNFGPPWYEPESGIERALNGDQITIVGGMVNDEHEVPMVIVYELNGEIWRDSTAIGPHFGGGWFHGNMSGSMQFHSPFDSDDHMIISEGWRNGGGHGGHGGMMPDSLFAQMLEIFPENVPNSGQMNIVAGYEIHMFEPDGRSGMGGRGGMGGGHMSFGSDVNFQFHYNENQVNYYNDMEESICPKFWDDETGEWITPDYTLDTQNNLVTFSSSEISNFVVLTADKVLSDVTLSGDGVPSDFSLSQNYPNPFNPATTIEFSLPDNGFVALNVYNIIGQKVATLLNTKLNAGIHSVRFDASGLPSGIYLYKLQIGNESQVRKMNLMK